MNPKICAFKTRQIKADTTCFLTTKMDLLKKKIAESCFHVPTIWAELEIKKSKKLRPEESWSRKVLKGVLVLKINRESLVGQIS